VAKKGEKYIGYRMDLLMHLLSGRGAMTTNEIAEETGEKYNAVWESLKRLRERHLVFRKRREHHPGVGGQRPFEYAVARAWYPEQAKGVGPSKFMSVGVDLDLLGQVNRKAAALGMKPQDFVRHALIRYLE